MIVFGCGYRNLTNLMEPVTSAGADRRVAKKLEEVNKTVSFLPRYGKVTWFYALIVQC